MYIQSYKLSVASAESDHGESVGLDSMGFVSFALLDGEEGEVS